MERERERELIESMLEKHENKSTRSEFYYLHGGDQLLLNCMVKTICCCSNGKQNKNHREAAKHCCLNMSVTVHMFRRLHEEAHSVELVQEVLGIAVALKKCAVAVF